MKTQQNGYHPAPGHRAGAIAELFSAIGYDSVFFDLCVKFFAEQSEI
jgi:hypothetical protein